MDKAILDKLIKFGLVTNIGVDASKYKDVDDLITKGVITIPGAKTRIMQLLEGLEIQSVETDTETITDVEVKEDDIVEVTEVDETETPVEEVKETVEVVEETPVEETVTEELPVEEVTETVEEAPVEESVETTEETPKKKKSTKKAEQAE